MDDRKIDLGVIMIITLVTTTIIGIGIAPILQQHSAFAATFKIGLKAQAPIATSGDKNVYVAWWTNKTGNDEVMFKASADAGKTFGNKMNLSNSPKSDSQDAQIAASGNNVYISWWDRNATTNEPVLRASNDNGKTFGPPFILTTGATSTVVTMTRK